MAQTGLSQDEMMRAAARRLVSTWPPLSEHQRNRLRALLMPVVSRADLQKVRDIHYKYLVDNPSASRVYAIKDLGDRFKIGLTSGPSGYRLRTLQTGNAETLEAVWLMPGGRDLELRLHRAMDSRRIRGEWFSQASDVRHELDVLAYEMCREGPCPACKTGVWTSIGTLRRA